MQNARSGAGIPAGSLGRPAARVVAFAAALALTGGAAAQTAADAGRQALQDGERLWRLKRTRSALEALEKAAASKDSAAQAYERIGRIYLFKGSESEGIFPGWHEEAEYREKALHAFDEALKRAPALEAARVGRWKALRALGRDAGPEPALVPPADAAPAEQIQKLRAEKKHVELIEQARGFAARFPDSERLPAVYDALIEAYQATPATPTETISAAIDARIAARPDPGAYITGANLLVSRGALDQGAKLAVALVPAAETFIDENLGSYKLAEKAKGSLNGTRATSADLTGWILFQKGDAAGAEAKLLEAERLSRGQDFRNQLHLAELRRTKGAAKEAREGYLNALSLAGGAEAQRAAGQKELAQLRASEGHDAAGFAAWLKGELDRRREERRAQALGSMLDRAVPKLPLTSLSGEPVDMSKLRGKVLLYKFFASW